MNYRHHFHAGNFADVVKHALVARLVTAMQRKEKGLLYLDTHAGRGSYDLELAARGDSLVRQPEWPQGIGRLWAADALPELLKDYVAGIRLFDRQQGNLSEQPRFYPGSPVLVAALMRSQDRMVLCEHHPDECEALRATMARTDRCSVQQMDGYVALRAMLPPPEKRALVLVDPPFEAEDEFATIVRGVREALTRLPSAVIAIWYPLTKRARVDAFFSQLGELDLPPTAVAELAVAGDSSLLKMRGCGLVLINPPWQFEVEAVPALTSLAGMLAQDSGATGRYWWLVPEC